jgi:hypothetical protein
VTGPGLRILRIRRSEVVLAKIVKGSLNLKRWGGVAALVAALVLVQISTATADEATRAKSKHTIKDVMKGAYKGDTSLRSRIVAGTATAEQKKQFLELTEALSANKPPKGDNAAWDTKVATLIKSSHDLLDGTTAAAATPDAAKLEAFKAASDCKACHMAHKGK